MGTWLSEEEERELYYQVQQQRDEIRELERKTARLEDAIDDLRKELEESVL